MHQHSLAGTGARDAEQHVVGGQVADRHRGGFLEAHRIRHRQHLPRGHADHIGMPPETGQGQHPLACRVALGTITEPVDHPGHLVADDARRLGGIGIQPLGGHNLREVQAGPADTNPDLARAGLRIGRFPHLQGLGPARPSDPDRSHRHILRGRQRIRASPFQPRTDHIYRLKPIPIKDPAVAPGTVRSCRVPVHWPVMARWRAGANGRRAWRAG
jgi:hypothetical protein